MRGVLLLLHATVLAALVFVPWTEVCTAPVPSFLSAWESRLPLVEYPVRAWGVAVLVLASGGVLWTRRVSRRVRVVVGVVVPIVAGLIAHSTWIEVGRYYDAMPAVGSYIDRAIGIEAFYAACALLLFGACGYAFLDRTRPNREDS